LPLSYNKPITQQTKLERISLYEYAEDNPVLARAIRKVSREGGIVI
jgi:hypothetical protein